MPLIPLIRKPKILVVVDSTTDDADQPAGFGISFSSTVDATDLSYFSISHLLHALEADITKAHRQLDPSLNRTIYYPGAKTPADIENFRFSSDSLAGFDEVWLIGYNETRPDTPLSSQTPAQKAAILADTELRALTSFMDSGGGVFAAGDHAGLGLTLCGTVPRVRSMRKWWWPTQGPNGEPVAPPPTSSLNGNRLDTTRPGNYDFEPNYGSPGPNSVWFDDQSDDVPQYVVPWPFFFVNQHDVHPLFQGVINSDGYVPFADHMHEGEVVTPYELGRVFTFNGQKFEEYPLGTDGPGQPQIVAFSSTNGRFNVVPPWETSAHAGDPKNMSANTSFGCVGAYDGSLANVGRVVVESTFHHFLDINLIGDPVAVGAKQIGFRGSPAGNAVLASIDHYYNNVVSWLLPPYFSIIKWIEGVILAISIQPLRDVVTYPPAGALQTLGEMAVESLRGFAQPGMLLTWLRTILPDSISDVLPAFPWDPAQGTAGHGSFDFEELLRPALGAAVIAAADIRRHKGSQFLKTDKRAHEEIQKATLRGVATLSEDLERRGAGLTHIGKALGSIHLD